MDPLVDQVVECYLRAVDDEAPGFLEGLYLTGSAALGDFRPNTSDVDFVAVSTGRPDVGVLPALARAHARVRRQHPRPLFDGIYVTWQDLAGRPRDAGTGPNVYEGKFQPHRNGACEPVTWHTLAAHGVGYRGPAPADVPIWTDTRELKSWMSENFDAYWRPLLRRASNVSDRWSLISFTSYGACWIVLGVCRLHYSLATGRIASKHAAGLYGLETFPQNWHRVLNEALRIRESDRAATSAMSAAAGIVDDLGIFRKRSSLYRTPVARRLDTLAFADMIIGDAHSRPHTHG